MNKLQKLFFCLTWLLAFVGSEVKSQDFPERSNTIVTDYTNSLQSDEIQALEQKLVAFNDTSSTQIAVVLVPDLQGYDVQDYAVKLAEKWGIGQKGKNNGSV